MSRERVALGTPVDVTYKFVVADDAMFDQDYLVFVHALDIDNRIIWIDDHMPPVPTTQWKGTIEYTRTVFVPVHPYIGETVVQVGLYSPTTQQRLALAGQDMGGRAYRVARLQLAPQTENPFFTVFKDGWYPAEGITEDKPTGSWHWTRKEATLAFRNPRKDCVIYLDLDNPGGTFNEPQKVTVLLNGHPVSQVTVVPGQEHLHRIRVPAASLGANEIAELLLSIDRTFVPGRRLAGINDPRELGVRVFHVFIEPRR